MAIATRVVDNNGLVAVAAKILVATEFAGAAERKLRQRAADLRRGLPRVSLYVLTGIAFENLSDGQFWF